VGDPANIAMFLPDITTAEFPPDDTAAVFEPDVTVAVFPQQSDQQMSIFNATPEMVLLTGKAPFTSRQYEHDFSNQLQVGDTIETIDSVVSTPIGALLPGQVNLTIGTFSVVAGRRGAALAVGTVISGGSIGVNYQVTANIISAAGDQISLSYILPVENR
jgi:hypothetical protein